MSENRVHRLRYWRQRCNYFNFQVNLMWKVWGICIT